MTREQANEAFIRAFQQRAGVTVDGWAGSETHAALNRLIAAPVSLAYDVTERVALELLHHEAIVREAYKDSVGVWAWGVGVTNASGHEVYPRYKDNPQSLERVLEIFVWLLKTKYGPDVKAAFGGRDLTEEQFAAALSFHYNTGAIGVADWVDTWLSGQVDKARAEIMNWRKPASIIGRRTAERDLFFSGVWSQTGLTTEYPVAKPSYAPKWSGAKKIDVREALRSVL